MKLLFDIGCNKGLYTDVNINKFDKFVLVDANNNLINELTTKYRNNSNIVLLNKIVSNKPTEDFYICNGADTISTSDIDWVNNSRFSNNNTWTKHNNIETISLDKMIELFGIPNRIKIDVEGYELNVVKSLTVKIPELCFEWAEEKMNDMIETVIYLKNLGYTNFHVQEEDKYDYIPIDFITYDKILAWINTLNPYRKQKWGMIWCK